MDIPTGPADLTPAWLSEALTASGVNAEVRAVDVADGSAGRGFACQILRLTLAYAAEVVEAPRSLIAKLPRATSGEPALWAANEIAWYRGDTCPVRTPRCYWAEIDAKHTRYCLLLEDLDALAVVHQADGASPQQALAVVGTIATLHARFWGTFDGERSTAWATALRSGVTAGWDAFVALFADLLKDELRNSRNRFVQSIERIGVYLQRNCGTVVHGDLKLDNVLFGPAGTSDAVVLLDWQAVGTGAAAVELAGFMQTSMTREVRVSMEPALLDAYLTGLRAGGVRNYGAKQLRRDYRLGLLISLAAAIGGCPSIASGRWAQGDARRKFQILDYARMTFERRIASVRDNQAIELL